MSCMKKGFDHFIQLLITMTGKELKVRYKNTIFGYLWMMINPLLQMLVIGFIFNFFIKEPIKNYNYYLFLGLLIWNFFSLSLTKGTHSIILERNLIKKAKFNHLVIPFSIILSNLTHLLLAFIVFIIPVIFLGTLTFWSLPIILLAFILLIAFSSGLILLSSSLNVRFRDINFFVQAILIVWFYATPIVYSIDFIPEKFIWLWRLNPMVSILQLFQNGVLNFPMPDLTTFLVNIITIAVILVIGVFIFYKESKNFDDWI